MNCRELYFKVFLPSYQNMLTDLDLGEVGTGEMLAVLATACSKIVDLTDYVAKEFPGYVEREWGATNGSRFQDNLESKCHTFYTGQSSTGEFFGWVRDIANVYKHKTITRHGRRISAVSQLKEGCISIKFSDKRGDYYSDRKGVLLSLEPKVSFPAEIFLYHGYLAITTILINAGAIPCPPSSIKKHYRIFKVKRRSSTVGITIPFEAMDGEKASLTVCPMIFDKHKPYYVRPVEAGEGFNHTVKCKLHVRPTIFVPAS